MSIHKLKTDERSYFLRIIGQIPVLLISDPKSHQGAISISFNAGSMNCKISGLAHFLEHDFFEGSRKYQENFQNYVDSVSGTTNAFTASEKTVFVCSHSKDSTKKTIETFISLFEDPLLLDKYAEKEKNAVNNEFQMDMSIEGWRELMVVKSAIHSLNPQDNYSTCGCGNLESLKEVRSADLRQFYKTNYSHCKIFAVVLSTKTIPEIIGEITNTFQSLSKALSPTLSAKPTTTPSPFKTLIGRQISMKSIEKKQTLSMNFPIDSVFYDPQLGDLRALSLLIQFPANFPLYLEGRDLASSVDAGISENYSFGSLFTVEMILTENGAQKIGEIIGHFFAFIEKIKTIYAPDSDILHSHMKFTQTLLENELKYTDKKEAFSLVEELVQSMDRCCADPTEAKDFGDVLSGNKKLQFGRAKEHLTQTLNAISSKNFYVLFSSPNVADTDTVEQWFKVPYKMENLPPILPAEYSGRITEIADRFPPNQDDQILFDSSRETLKKTEENGIIVVSKPEFSFLRPHVAFKADFMFDSAEFPRGLSVEEFVVAEIAESILNRNLDVKYGDYFLAMNVFSVGVEKDRFTLCVETFTGEFDDMLSKATNTARTFFNTLAIEDDSLREKFLRTKKNFLVSLHDSLLCKPYEHCLRDFTQFVKKSEFTPTEMLNALEHIDFEKYQKICRSFSPKNFWIKSLLFGNFSEGHLQKVKEELNTFRSSPTSSSQALRCVTRKTDENFVLAKRSHNPVETNSACVVALRIGNAHIIRDLFTQLLCAEMSNRFFQRLRVQKQLGYVASSSMQIIRGQSYIVGFVQSSTYGAQYLSGEIKRFFGEYFGNLGGTQTPVDVKPKILNLIEKLKTPPKSFGESFAKHWCEIESERYLFDVDQTKIGLLEAIQAHSEECLKLFAESLLARPKWEFWALKPGTEEEFPRDFKKTNASKPALLKESVVSVQGNRFTVGETKTAADVYRTDYLIGLTE